MRAIDGQRNMIGGGGYGFHFEPKIAQIYNGIHLLISRLKWHEIKGQFNKGNTQLR